MKSKFRGNRCFLCGRECVPATDARGEHYMGCPVCRTALLDEHATAMEGEGATGESEKGDG